MEEVGLLLSFEETKIRGSDEVFCILRATEEGTSDIIVEETLGASSWENFKKRYPTLKDVLIDLFTTNSWDARWRGGNRLLFVKSVVGNEGLYHLDDNEDTVVYWDEI